MTWSDGEPKLSSVPEATIADASGAAAHPAVAPACLDCGAPVRGAYCHRCGQRHEPQLKPVSAFLSEAVADALNLDARLYRTLGRLVTRPGLLTNEYVAGRRTRYVPPFRLYLGISVLYFAVFLATGSSRFFIFWTAGADAQYARFVRLLPQLMFLLLPLFAGLIALLYRRRFYAAHVVFALHYHAFAFLVLPLVSILQPPLRRMSLEGSFGVVGTIALLASTAVEVWVIAYLYFALRRVYGGSRLLTVATTIALFLAYMAVLAAAGTLLVPSIRQTLWAAFAGA